MSFQNCFQNFPQKSQCFVKIINVIITHHIRYAWTISVCAHCDHHMGWRFTAVNRKLRPRKFWGISRLVFVTLSNPTTCVMLINALNQRQEINQTPH